MTRYALAMGLLLLGCQEPGQSSGAPGPAPDVVDPCQDDQKGADETDVDCGGPSCAPCAEGLLCAQDADCASAVCGADGVCRVASCGNNVVDPGETGVDCGGPCPLCFGDPCSTDDACRTGYCAEGACAEPTCADGVSNGMETGVDCGGGGCPQCAVGQVCEGDDNCLSSFCLDGFCADPGCNDNVLNGGESDVDCGGPCPGCALGKTCETASDCDNAVCIDNVCTEPPQTCSDGEKNGTETDVDCGGGSCSPCASTKFCAVDGDCLSDTCIFGVCKDPTCDDGRLNQGESDVDCGGPCAGCDDGDICTTGEDCASERCLSGICVSCDNGVEDADELGVDCGGACPACVDGSPCEVDEACQGELCVDGTCVSCSNGELDGDESAVDCGGSCEACPLGEACTSAADCGDNICEEGLCCTPNACGVCGPLADEVCNGIDDNCDGTVDGAAELGAAPACDLQQGVCAGAQAQCQASAGFVCDASVYAAHDPAYEASETSCDGIDNDCDGSTDEGLLNVCGDCGADPVETCNGVDDDCDGSTDEGLLNVCGECGPDPVEVCNGVDDDCDGSTDEGLLNVCGECGPDPVEVCNGVDDDCDGSTDEGLLNTCGGCGPQPVEMCNGVDDDCDGGTDDLAECAACDTEVELFCEGSETGPSALAWAHGHLHLGYLRDFDSSVVQLGPTGAVLWDIDVVGPGLSSTNGPMLAAQAGDLQLLFPDGGETYNVYADGVTAADWTLPFRPNDLEVYGDNIAVSGREFVGAAWEYTHMLSTADFWWNYLNDYATDDLGFEAHIAVSASGETAVAYGTSSVTVMRDDGSTVAVPGSFRIEDAVFSGETLHLLARDPATFDFDHFIVSPDDGVTGPHALGSANAGRLVRAVDGGVSAVLNGFNLRWYTASTDYTTWTLAETFTLGSGNFSTPATLTDPLGRIHLAVTQGTQGCVWLVTRCPDAE